MTRIPDQRYHPSAVNVRARFRGTAFFLIDAKPVEVGKELRAVFPLQ